MRSRLLLAIFVVLHLPFGEARADSTDTGPVTIKLHYMPPGHRYVVLGVGEVRYFLFEEYKLLLKLDHNLFIADQTVVTQKKTIADLREISAKNLEIADHHKEQTGIYKVRSERLQKNWEECEDKLVKKSGVDIPSLLLGGGIGIIVGAVVTVVIVVAAK